MQLELAKTEEFLAVRDFYWELIDLMKGDNCSVGWQKGIYPSDEYLRSSLANKELYVLRQRGKISACVILNSAWNEGYEGVTWGMECRADEVLMLHALGVHPRLQKTGLGRDMVMAVIDIARTRGKKTLRLDILARNIGARKLYEKTGFHFVTAKDMYYEDTGWTEFWLYELMLADGENE